MKKIPTVFRRDPNNPATVLNEWHPDCLWVRDGEGNATRKYDGTCVRLTPDGQWWARREVKPGKTPPPAYVPVETDPATGKTVGWEPIEQSPFYKAFTQTERAGLSPGTYELVGPKINGNPERFETHALVMHAQAEIIPVPARTFEALRDLVVGLARAGIEGVVFHHPDGRMAKLKGRDFR